MRIDEGMTAAGGPLAAMLAAGAEVRLGETRRAEMRERVVARALAAGPTAAHSLPRAAARRRDRRPLAMRLVAFATAASVFGGGAAAYASEGAMPGDMLYPVKRGLQAAGLRLAPTASLRAGLAIRMADDRLREAADVGSTDPARANELANEAQEMLYEAAAQAGDMAAEARDEVVARLIAIGVRQREHLMEIAARLPDAAQAGIMRAIARAGGEARARAIEVHLARAAREVAARAKAQAAQHAGGVGGADAAGQGSGKGATQTTGKGRGSDAERGRSGESGADGPADQGQDNGSAGGRSGGGKSGGGSPGGSSGSGSNGGASGGNR